jgi:hypothetical protein
LTLFTSLPASRLRFFKVAKNQLPIFYALLILLVGSTRYLHIVFKDKQVKTLLF